MCLIITFQHFGGIAQLGEHLICIQKVAGSIPVASTKKNVDLKLLTNYKQQDRSLKTK